MSSDVTAQDAESFEDGEREGESASALAFPPSLSRPGIVLLEPSFPAVNPETPFPTVALFR